MNRSVISCTVSLFIVSLASVSCKEPLGGGAYDVSLVRLLAEPTRFDSKRVLTSGFAYKIRGDYALFLTEADARYDVRLNSVTIELDTSEKIREFSGEYVSVVGEFEYLGDSNAILRGVKDVLIHPRLEEERSM